MPTTARSWQREHPEEMVWMLAHPESTYTERFRLFGMLDVADTSDLFSQIADAMEDGDAPAEVWDGLLIPNGDYSVKLRRSLGDITTFHYRVYTVRNGPLAGKRIVKHRYDGGIFKGFGFVTKGSGFSLWRRYESSANELYVRVWMTAVAAMKDDAMHAEGCVGSTQALTRYQDGAAVSADMEEGRIFVAHDAITCLLCNEGWNHATFYDQIIPVGLCYADEHNAPENSSLTPERYEEARAEFENDPARMAVALSLPLSELGDGSIQ